MSTSTARIFHGAANPEALEVTIVTGDSGLVMTTVTAASFYFVDSTQTPWLADISVQTATSMKATHIFASDGSDVPTPKNIKLMAHLTTPGGMRRAGPFTLTIT